MHSLFSLSIQIFAFMHKAVYSLTVVFAFLKVVKKGLQFQLQKKAALVLLLSVDLIQSKKSQKIKSFRIKKRGGHHIVVHSRFPPPSRSHIATWGTPTPHIYVQNDL